MVIGTRPQFEPELGSHAPQMETGSLKMQKIP